MASIEHRGEFSWRVVWRRGGRGSKKEFATLPTEREAEIARDLVEARRSKISPDEVYAAILGQIDDGGEPPPTLAVFAGQWIEQRRAEDDVQPDTLDEQHGMIMRRILPRLGNMPVTAITRETVTDWLTWLRKQHGRSGKPLDSDTVRKAHAVLHSLLAGAVPKWLPTNPAARQPGERKIAGLPKATPHDAIFLTPAEVELILANCSPAIRDMVYVAVRTGLRLGELLALRVEDLQLTGKRKVIQVRRARKRDGTIGTPKSRRSRRDVSISPGVAQVLAERTRGNRQHELVFASPRGELWRPPNLARRHWLPAIAAAMRCEEHPPPLPPKPKSGPRRKWRMDEVSTCDCPTRLHRRPRFHDLRHTHVSLCVEDGWDMLRVSRRIGHNSIQTTADIYGHLWDTDSDDRLDSLERLLKTQEDEAA